MKLRDLVLILVLVGAAIFFAFRGGDAEQLEKSGTERDKGRSEGRASSAGPLKSDQSRTVTKSSRRPRDTPQIVTTESGLQYEVLVEGTGDHPGPTDKVEVHYEGILEDGTVFDSSYNRNQSATFGLNQVIKGWTEGLQLMKPGAKYRFTIPPELAYGERGAGSSIPGNSTLVFEVELLSINARK